ncbi:MAG: IPT/TIG domain-containing protein [Bacteroidales bacterium]|jgi:hypothetical protein|nr:IPT/TIG domain-containing protein [Bacteroidales bacterium]
MKFKNTFLLCAAALFIAGYGMTGCSEEGGYEGPAPVQPSDPSQSVVFSDYSPKEGSARTLIFIEGSNFGTDLSKIKVTIGGVAAPVVGSNGSKICAMTPRHADAGDVRVSILGADGQVLAEHLFADLMTIHSTLLVGTLTGKVDPSKGENDNSGIINGTFEEAEFQSPWWLEFDIDEEGNKILYCMDNNASSDGNLAALRKINLTAGEVSTVFMKGQAGMHQVKSMTFESSTRDTLFFVDDNGKGNWTDRHAMPNIFYALRSEGFRKAYPYLYGQCSYSAVSMGDGTVFYNTWVTSSVYKARAVWDETAKMWDGQSLFSVKANSENHVYMCRHPEDLYVYMNGFNGVYRCAYDKANKVLISSVLHAGDPNGGGGWADGPGSTARFDRPRQGVFVKNPEYVAEGKADVYDYYVCDHNTNSIRKVTPEGLVSTFAGRGSVGTDGRVWGWIDGEARDIARFREPCGIAYDEETGIFYVADRNNKRIRTISVE